VHFKFASNLDAAELNWFCGSAVVLYLMFKILF